MHAPITALTGPTKSGNKSGYLQT